MSRTVVLGVIALLCACGSPDPRPREPQPLPSKASPAPSRQAPEASAPPTPALKVEERDPTPDEVPLPGDFAADATRQITKKNLRTELEAIEKELQASP